MPSVLQAWVNTVPCKMQSVLMSSLRGCDTVGKEDPSKAVVRSVRNVLLHDAEGTSAFTHNSVIGCIDDDGQLTGPVAQFIKDLDHYPVHFVMHLCHACEIIGFKHPNERFAKNFLRVYHEIVRALHTLPETEAHLDIRLADRVFGPDERAAYDGLSVVITPDMVELRRLFDEQVAALREDFRAREGEIRAATLRDAMTRTGAVAHREPERRVSQAGIGGYRG